MKNCFLFLVILLFDSIPILLSKEVKELPAYETIEIDNKENFFLKTDIFKINKEIELYFITKILKAEYGRNPYLEFTLYYCFSDQIKDFSCLNSNYENLTYDISYLKEENNAFFLNLKNK